MRTHNPKPGDIGLVWCGGETFVGMLCEFDGLYWCGVTSEGFAQISASSCDGLSSLVVIDPEDREQVERLSQLYKNQYWDADAAPVSSGHVDALQAALREFANPTPVRGTVVSGEQVKALLRQVETDREQDYWAEGHPDILDAAHAYLSSLADHLGVTS